MTRPRNMQRLWESSNKSDWPVCFWDCWFTWSVVQKFAATWLFLEEKSLLFSVDFVPPRVTETSKCAPITSTTANKERFTSMWVLVMLDMASEDNWLHKTVMTRIHVSGKYYRPYHDSSHIVILWRPFSFVRWWWHHVVHRITLWHRVHAHKTVSDSLKWECFGVWNVVTNLHVCLTTNVSSEMPMFHNTTELSEIQF